MGHLRFWRRIKIFPGVYLNFSKSGVSVSLGPRGAKLTLGKRGARATAGIPGTGLSYTHQVSKDKLGGDADSTENQTPTSEKTNG